MVHENAEDEAPALVELPCSDVSTLSLPLPSLGPTKAVAASHPEAQTSPVAVELRTSSSSTPTPLTILTGFLGAGPTHQHPLPPVSCYQLPARPPPLTPLLCPLPVAAG